MEKCEIMEQSILKNLQELSEFLVLDCGIDNYYDLFDYIADLHNFRAKMYKIDKKLTEKVMKQVEEEKL